MKKHFSILFFCLLCAVNLSAQIPEPVQVQTSLKSISSTESELAFKFSIEDKWHVYSTDLTGGPTSATLNIESIEGATLIGKLTPSKNEVTKYDPMFSMEVRYFEHEGEVKQKIKITDSKTFKLVGYLEYGACDDKSCLPPTQVEFEYGSKDVPQTPAKTPAKTEQSGTATTTVPNEQPAAAVEQPSEAVSTPSTTVDTPTSVSELTNEADLWKPVIEELRQLGEEGVTTDRSWLFIFLSGFLGGLVALFTPCVWPIIPMTVSFFLKRTKDKKKGIRDAWTYGASIVVIYVTLGLLITAIFDANSLNDLSTNAIFNVLLFLILVVFAASFFGAFEITLPSRWSNAIDSKAESTSGLVSIFLMAFTLALVSFSCTGPIIGGLLVAVSSTGSFLAPAIGMLGFAIALALPFTLFALFPSWLNSMPKSGSWMNVIKVVLGFLELAFALKFLSVADLAYGWGILDRETFLALWIIIFALLGVYLLGKIKFPHDDDNTKVSVPRFFMALVSLAFAVYMVPGLWGAPLKAISAFPPPMSTQDFNLSHTEVHAVFDDYEIGMEYARKNNKPVIVDFTGWGCVNCREMEAAVWTDEKVSEILNNDYVLISLYVDDKTKLPKPLEVTVNGKKRKLRSVGDKWSYLQNIKFDTNAQPFYVLLDNNGQPLNKSYAYDKDVEKYVNWLQQGLKNYKK